MAFSCKCWAIILPSVGRLKTIIEPINKGTLKGTLQSQEPLKELRRDFDALGRCFFVGIDKVIVCVCVHGTLPQHSVTYLTGNPKRL